MKLLIRQQLHEETNELFLTLNWTLPKKKLEEPEQKDTIPLESEIEEPEMEDAPSGPKNGSFLERLPNIKHERNRRLVKRSLILIGLFSIPALLLLYYISPLAKLGGVSIKGNEKISTEIIEKELNFSVGDNLWSHILIVKIT